MDTRKDVIRKKSRPPEEMKNTDIRTLFTRPYDFKTHGVIFDYRNEYKYTKDTSHIFFNYSGIETELEYIKKLQKPHITLENEQPVCRNAPAERKLVNVGFHENIYPYSPTTLFCHEEMLMSVPNLEVEKEIPKSFSIESKVDKEEEDPFADSDDSRDKDYIPDNSSNTLSHETAIMDDKNISVDHDENSTLLNLIIERDSENIANSKTALCEYDGCNTEIFSTCGKCLSYLCFSHFINENTYNGCENHNSSYLEQTPIIRKKGNQIKKKQVQIYPKLKKILNQKMTSTLKKENKRKNAQDITVQRKSNKRRENLFEEKKSTKDIRRNSTTYEKSDKNMLLTHVSRKRRHIIDVCFHETFTTLDESITQNLEPETSQPPLKRKKYSNSLLERKTVAKNNRISNHSVKPACGDKCLKKCTTQFSEDDRISINALYWKFTWQQQHSFIRAHTSVAIPKRKSNSEPKRNPRRTFSLKKPNNLKIDVCKIFFLTTLGYEKTNDRPLHNDFTNDSIDKRGKHQKTPAFDRDLLTQHVESFHPLQPHYRREHAPLRRYLQNDLNVVQMHKMFCETYPDKTVSYELYRQHLNKMNISFTQLGNEECEMCEMYSLHKKETAHDTEILIVEGCTVCVEWANHRVKYVKSRDLYNKHKSVKSDSEKYFSVDLEKVIMLPRMEMFKSVLFCQRLTVFNETFAPLGKITANSKPLTVIWHDAIAGRKQNDILSAFFHFFIRNRDVLTIQLWLDNCSSQNKNWLLYSLLVYLVNSNHISTERVILNYFEPGHTFMSCDQVHHQVELAIKKRKKLYDFSDFEDAVASINNSKVHVKSMGIQDFINVPNFVSDRRVQKSDPRAYLSKMVQVCFTRNNYDLLYKNDFDDEYITLRFLNDKFLKNPSSMSLEYRSEPKGIDANRKSELLKTLTGIIPKHKLVFWENLPVAKVDDNKKDANSRKSYLIKT